MRRRVLLLLLALAALVGAGTTAPSDSVAVANPAPGEAWRLRGTAAPLVRETSGGQRLVHALTYVPSAAVEIAVRPVTWAVGLDERLHLVRRASRLLAWELKPVDTRISARFGYESGFGVTLLGLHADSDDWFGTGIDYGLTVGYLNPRNNLVDYEFGSQPGKLDLTVQTRFERKDNRPFYGLGDDSEPVRHDFHRQFFLNECALHARPAAPWQFDLCLYQRNTDLDEPDAGRPEAGENPVVAASFPALYATAATSRYRGAELRATWDGRDDGDFSVRGGLLRLVGGYNAATSAGDADYRHYSGELQVFRTLWRGDRALALRVFAEGMDTPDRDRVPFTEMAALGGRYYLRGYPSHRFVDTHAVLLTTEYRYPITDYLQGRLFGEWGGVAPAWDDFRNEQLHHSYGLALAFRVQGNTFTVQYARSPEDDQVFIGTSSVFSLRPRRTR